MTPFIDLADLEEKELLPGCKGRFLHTDNMTVVYWHIDAGAPLPEHAHPHEQIVNIMAGEYELTVKGNTRLLTPGSIVVIPSNVVHSGKARTECSIIDIFHPVREDYR